MATVFIPAPLRSLAGGQKQFQLDGGSVRQLVVQLEAACPGMAEQLVKNDALASGLAVSVDGVISNRGLATKVGPASEVHFLPAIGGG